MSKIRVEQIKVSVLMSCYNGSEWIKESIQSVLNQTFTQFEFIIINDGSTDDSLNIINGFAEQDERILVIDKKNTGLTDSLNIGLNLARAEWIARIDCDDVCDSFRFEKQMALAQADPDFVFVGSAFYIINETGKIVKEYPCPASHAELQNNLYNAGFFPPHSSAFFRADAAKKIGGYRVRIKRAQDWDLWLRLSQIGKLTAVQEPLVKIRKHSAQVSNEDSGKRQVTDCAIGTVSTLVTVLGAKDPVAADEATFDNFRLWIIRELEKEQYFQFYQYLDKVRDANTKNTGLYGTIAIGFALLSSPFFMLRFIHRKLVGNNMYRRLAFKWLKQQANH